MNEVPPDQGEADEVDDLYRRASAADTSRPSEPVRRAILDHAVQLAAQRSREAGPVKIDFTRRAANQPWRRPAIFGTLAAAALAGLMIGPQFFSPRITDTSVSSISENSPRQSGAAPAAKGPVNESQAPANASPEPFPAPAPQANDRMAQTQTDRLRGLNTNTPARVAGRVDASRQAIAADSARAETETLAKVLTTQAQSAADARSAANEQRGANEQRAANELKAANAPSDANPPSSAADEASAKTEARRTQSPNSSFGALMAARPRTPSPTMPPSVAPAARAADPAAQLRRAAEIGDLSSLQAVLDTQPAIDARDDRGRTALMMATLHGQSRAVEMLLASGADPNAADAQGTTPLQAAMAANQPAVAEALRRAGAR